MGFGLNVTGHGLGSAKNFIVDEEFALGLSRIISSLMLVMAAFPGAILAARQRDDRVLYGPIKA
jgi:hypothetical protein